MGKRMDLFYVAMGAYVLATLLLFLSTIVGIPGILLHGMFKKEKAALPFYQAAIALGSNNTNILAAYGLSQLRDYKPTEAREIFERAKANTNHYLYIKTLTANIALCHWKEGNIKEAVKTYEDLYYYPDLEPVTDFSLENTQEGLDKNHNFYAQDFTTMAFILHLDGQEEKAEYFSHVSIQKTEDYGPAYDNLGQIEYGRGNNEKAIEYFQKGLEYQATMIDSYYYLGKIALDENRKDDAKKHFSDIDLSRVNGLSTITEDDVKKALALAE
jgi:Tfp pilus assembly protein PilF